MKRLLKKLLQGLTYLAAGLLILLAVAVGIFRLMLPRLPEYQEEIKTWASSAVGMGVDFRGLAGSVADRPVHGEVLGRR